MLAAIVTLVLSAVTTLAIPSSFRWIIDRGLASDAAEINGWFKVLLGLVILMAISSALRFYFITWLGERVVGDVRIAVHRRLVDLAPSFFEENRPSEIASRLIADTQMIEHVVSTTLSVALRNTVLGIGGLIYLFTLSPKLTGTLLIGIPLVIAPVVVLGAKVRDIARTGQARVAEIGSMASEVFGAMRIVHSFNQRDREARRFASAVARVLAAAKRRIQLRTVMMALMIGLIFSGVALVLWQGALDVQAGRLSGGSIAAFVLTGGLVANACSALTEVYGEVLRGAGAAARLAELMAEVPTIKRPASPQHLPPIGRSELRFEGVTFHYPTRPEVGAIIDVSLTVTAGETLAVVGPSGAGKSTLFQLAQRFYDPASGTIRLDGIDLRYADPDEVRARMALVPQETVIFAASARDNLRYGCWDADDAALWAAAEAANAAGFLHNLPDGLDTYLGEGGARLSGGQRQRIAIARAILRDAPLLLLDEATSSLDAESERLVQDSIDHLVRGRTTIVIAHRLATVRTADRIVVMDHGRIVEEGTHASLTERGGLYARLARLQFDGLPT